MLPLPPIDLKTLILLTIFFFGVNGIFLRLVHRSTRQAHFKYLALGCFSFALGWGLYALRFAHGINLLSLPLANIFLLLLPISLLWSTLSFAGIRPSRLHVRSIRAMLLGMFVVLVLAMNDPWIPGMVTSVVHGFFYVLSGVLLMRYAQSVSLMVRLILGLNLFMALIILARSAILWLGWQYPGAIAGPGTAQLLAFTLFFNIICLYAQVLCFPVLHFIASEKTLSTANQKLESLSSIDPLTGLLNRRTLDDVMALRMASLHCDGTPFSVILFDIDHFKAVNDDFGHLAGDHVLGRMAELIGHTMRVGDHVFRFGGEEFLMVLAQTSLHQAHEVAERLRQTIRQSRFEHADLPAVFHIAASFGVATADVPTCTVDGLLKQVDVALYRAKLSGRDQVCLYSPAASEQVFSLPARP